MSKRIKGFSVVEALIITGVVVLLVGLGFVGYKSFTKSSSTTASTNVSAKQSAQVITTKADLEAAEKELDNLDFSSDENADQAEAQANL